MIQRKMPELNGKARIIAENILADPESVIQEKASDLAKRSGVDSARVVRLCQQLGFEGFPDLKKQLVDEFLSQRSTLERQIAPANTPIEKLKVQFATDFTRTINDTLAELDEAQLKKALTLFTGAKCIYLAGYGSSALAALDMQTKLRRLFIQRQYGKYLENDRRCQFPRCSCSGIDQQSGISACKKSRTYSVDCGG